MNTKVFKKALVCLTLVIPFANSSSYCADEQPLKIYENVKSIPGTVSNLNNFKNDSDNNKQDGNEKLKFIPNTVVNLNTFKDDSVNNKKQDVNEGLSSKDVNNKQGSNEESKNIFDESDVNNQKLVLLQMIDKCKDNPAIFDKEVKAVLAQVLQTSSISSTCGASLVPYNNQQVNITGYHQKEESPLQKEASQLQIEYVENMQISALEKSKQENEIIDIDNKFFSIPGKSKNNVNMIMPGDDIFYYNSTPEEQQEVRNYFEHSSRLLHLVNYISSDQTQDNKNYRSDKFDCMRNKYIKQFQQEVNNSKCKQECKQLIINASKFMNSDVRFRSAMDELFSKLYDTIFGIVYSDAAYVSQEKQPEPYYRVVDKSKLYYNQELDNKLVKMINGYEIFDDLIKGIIELQNVKSDNKSDNKADIQNVEADIRNVLADFKGAMNSSNKYGSAFQYLAKLYDEALKSYFNYVNGVQSFYTLLKSYFNKKDDNFIKEADAKRKEMLNLISDIKNKYNNVKTLVLAFTVLKECNEKIDISEYNK